MRVTNKGNPCLACLRADILAAGLFDGHFSNKTVHTCQPVPAGHLPARLAEILAALDAVIETGERGTIAEIRLVLGLKPIREAIEQLKELS